MMEDGPLAYKYYEEDFVLDFYGLTEILKATDVQIVQEIMTTYFNDKLDSSPVDLRVSNTRVLDQGKKTVNSIAVLAVNLRIRGQVVSINAQAIANISFENILVAIFSESPSQFKRSLKETSGSFDRLLAPRLSVLEYTTDTSDSYDKNLLITISASVSAAILTALVLGFCLWRQKHSNTSIESSQTEKEKDSNDELGIASTWSSSDDSSLKDEQVVQAPPLIIRTPPKSFPTQQRPNLSPCIEEGMGFDEQDDTSDVSSHEGIYSLKNWTYSTSSSSDESDAETVNISLSMQSIDEFEASIRSTPPRQRRVLLNI
jgi:hypothetical protein